MSEPWWKSAVVYQIYPRSFADSPFRDWSDGGAAYREKYPNNPVADANGDGVGDLEGIRRHLDDLVWLGVDALWISPFYRSPMADFGYDVSDYCDVDPLFGDLDDIDRLIAEAHERDLKVIVDWVPNHTSDQHPWFVESRASRHNDKRDWYIWRDPGPNGEPPNNWISSFSFTSAWELDERTGQMYLHCFLPEQPDLNWANPEVVAAMHGTLRFWLDRGVDGFRMDVVHLIGKDQALADDPPDLAALSHVPLNHRPETHQLLRDIRILLDSYEGDRMSVGEVYLLDTAMVAEYYGHNDELHLNFNFPPLLTPWDGPAWRRQIERAEAELDPIGAWPTWVLSNHDNKRHRTRYGGSEARSRAAAVMLLSLRGTPFLYAGEELGLEDAVVPDDRVVDPGGRDGCRAPMPWTIAAPHGWDGAEPWLPWSPESGARSYEACRADERSILHLYRRMLAARKASPALQLGHQQLLDAPDGVVAWERTDPATGDRRVTVVNLTDVPQAVTGVTGTVEVASDGDGEGQNFPGTVPAECAVLIRP